jgi:hypothetical protein
MMYGRDHFSNPPLDPTFEDFYQAIKTRIFNENQCGLVGNRENANVAISEGLKPNAPTVAAPHHPEREKMIDTPECNALESDPIDSFDTRAWKSLAQRLERRIRSSEAEGKDAVRMDYIQSRRATIYRSEVGHWVLVDETHRDRLGIIGKDLRDAVDKAMQPSLSRSEGK